MPFSEAPFSAIFQPLLSFFNFSGHVYIRLFQSSVVFHSSYFFNLNGVCGLPKGAKRPTKPLTLPIHSYGVLYLSCFCSSSGRGVVLYLALFRGSLWPFLEEVFGPFLSQSRHVYGLFVLRLWSVCASFMVCLSSVTSSGHL